MSAIARVMHERGVPVTGSDLKESRYARMLSELGMTVHIGHDAGNLGDPEVVVVSSAISERNPELAAARERGIDVWPRARMLAHLAEERATIAVAGTHGKTSTSAMIAAMFKEMGEDPTFLVGGELTQYSTNASCGSGPHYVVEADESDGSFVYLDPAVAMITNVEAEHLDHYGSLENVERTFVEFMARVPEGGHLVLCADDVRLLELASGMAPNRITYGVSEAADIRAHSLEADGLGTRFKVVLPDSSEVETRIALPGKHMVANATGAIAVAFSQGLDVAKAAQALRAFSGVKRRFDIIGEVEGVSIVDDYAHHPTEIRATLEAARNSGYERTWVLFQPHRYSRTAALGAEFGDAFGSADRVLIMDVYSAGETPIPGVTGKTVADAVLETDPRTQLAYLPHRADIVPYLVPQLRSGDLLLTMGAGDVTAVAPQLCRGLSDRFGGSGTCR